jgi:hypothetical protein
MIVPSFTIGVLGKPLFGLGFVESALGHRILQFRGRCDCLLFLGFWCSVWSASDGSVPVLVWLVGREAEYELHRFVIVQLLMDGRFVTIQLLYSMSWLVLDGLLPTSLLEPSLSTQ